MAAPGFKIERALQGPLGKKNFGKDWLKGLTDEQYRNYLCRAFYYCQIKEKYDGEGTDSVKQGLRADLQQIINGRIQPQLPASQRLTAYFQAHRFYIEKKSGSKTFKRYVIINAPELKLQYFNKEEGGKAKSKTYSIKDIKFERKEQNGVQVLYIQPLERPKGPLILTSEKNPNIGEVFSNITALQQKPQTSQMLQRFLRVYNYNIIKRLMIRFLKVHQYMRQNVMIRKHTVQDIRIINRETQEQARKFTVNIVQQALKIWLKEDPIHPPHFISEFQIQTRDQLYRELMNLETQGSMKDVNVGNDQGLVLDKIKYKNIELVKGKYIKEHPQDLKNALKNLPPPRQGKVTFQQIFQQQINSDELLLQTLPYGQISSIAVNSQPDKNILQIFGRSYIPKKSKLKTLLDPSDYGYYHCLISAQQKIDILILGIRDVKVSNLQDPSAYEYYLYVCIDKKRKVLIKGPVMLSDQRVNIDLQVPIRLNPNQDQISLILTRKTSQTSRDQFLCFDQDIPFNQNQK